jgi:hypothetical protein
MPLFRCEKCGCVENTAVCSYWHNKYSNGPLICYECETGKEHGMFPKTSANGWYIDADGFIYSPDSVDQETMEWRYNRTFKMVGRIES